MAQIKPDKLKEWDSKLETAKNSYGTTRNQIKTYYDYYEGTRDIMPDANTGRTVTKKATNVRNICYELVESQIDSSVPMPKVRAIHPEDDELARKIEQLLENKVRTAKLYTLNDAMERTVPILGGSYFHVQWDSNLGLHSQIGDVKVTEINPKKLIPQPGVVKFDDMDYFFIQESMTKKNVKRVYGVEVEDAMCDEPELCLDNTNSDLVNVNTAYYRNDHNGIGVYIWCDKYELLDLEDYESRYLDRCVKCGAVMQGGVCPICGGKKSEKKPEEYEELIDAVEINVGLDKDGNVKKSSVSPYDEEQVPMVDELGNPITDQAGQPQMEIKRTKKKIPYYKPNVFPVVLRKNISGQDKVLGDSDIKVVIDQQDTIKKLGTKVNEKLLKGGSFVTLPQGVQLETNGNELNIVRLNNAAEKALIDVLTMQPDVSKDENYIEMNYDWAKSALGITDSFQGKYDPSATSGTAKQYSINQSAGRLESKRTMKNEAYAELYKIMFKYWLAYADQATEITSTDSQGKPTHEVIDRKEFLRIDESGEFYWDDEFIFETDPSSTLMANREAMWSQNDLKLQSQAFGPLGDLKTLRTYWTLMKADGFPNAGKVLDIVEGQIAEQEAMEQQMMQQQMAAQMPPEEAQGEMPVL